MQTFWAPDIILQNGSAHFHMDANTNAQDARHALTRELELINMLNLDVEFEEQRRCGMILRYTLYAAHLLPMIVVHI